MDKQIPMFEDEVNAEIGGCGCPDCGCGGAGDEDDDVENSYITGPIRMPSGDPRDHFRKGVPNRPVDPR